MPSAFLVVPTPDQLAILEKPVTQENPCISSPGRIDPPLDPVRIQLVTQLRLVRVTMISLLQIQLTSNVSVHVGGRQRHISITTYQFIMRCLIVREKKFHRRSSKDSCTISWHYEGNQTWTASILYDLATGSMHEQCGRYISIDLSSYSSVVTYPVTVFSNAAPITVIYLHAMTRQY